MFKKLLNTGCKGCGALREAVLILVVAATCSAAMVSCISSDQIPVEHPEHEAGK